MGCGNAESQITYTDTTSSSSSSSVSSKNTEAAWGFEELGKMSPRGSTDDSVIYYRDIKTDVMYIFVSGYRKGGPTAMLDPETGLPLTYSRYKELYK